MREPRRKFVSLSFFEAAAALVVVYALAMMAFASLHRGIWLDEVWSLWMSRRDLSFRETVAERWMQDVHPPLFYLLTWATAPLVGDDIAVRRLLNFIPLAYFGASLVALVRAMPSARNFAVVLFVGVLTSRGALAFFPEHRSYFTELSLMGALMGCLYYAFLAAEDLRTRASLGMAALAAVTIIPLLNLHYIADVIIGLTLGAAALALFALKKPRWAALIVVATVVGVAPLIVAIFGELAFIRDMADSAWIATRPALALRMLAGTVAHALADNIVAGGVLAVVAAGAVMARRRAGPAAGTGRGTPPGAWVFAGAAGAAILLASCILMAASLLKPLLIARYVIALSVLAIAIIAALAADRIAARRWLAAAFCLNAAILVTVYGLKASRDARWYATATYIRSQVQACPSTVVYGVDPNFPLRRRPANYRLSRDADDLLNWGYATVGRSYGFEVRIASPGRWPRALAGRCPTLFWAEHSDDRTAPARLAAALAASPDIRAELDTAKVYRGPTGFVLSFPGATGR